MNKAQSQDKVRKAGWGRPLLVHAVAPALQHPGLAIKLSVYLFLHRLERGALRRGRGVTMLTIRR